MQIIKPKPTHKTLQPLPSHQHQGSDPPHKPISLANTTAKPRVRHKDKPRQPHLLSLNIRRLWLSHICMWQNYFRIFIVSQLCSLQKVGQTQIFLKMLCLWYLEQILPLVWWFWPLKAEKFRYLLTLTFCGKKRFVFINSSNNPLWGGVVVVNCEVVLNGSFFYSFFDPYAWIILRKSTGLLFFLRGWGGTLGERGVFKCTDRMNNNKKV